MPRDDITEEHDNEGPSKRAPGFVSSEYFRVLQESRNPSSPPSPRKRLVEPVLPNAGSPSAGPRLAENVNISSATSSRSPGISASAFSQGYFKRFFIEEKELGRGGKGVVLLVTHVLDDVRLGQYACKRVPVGNNHAWLQNVLTEVRLLEHLSHHHLVYYKHVWLEDVKISNFGPSVPCVFILQQYCNSGNLHEYIIKPADVVDALNDRKERARRLSKENTGRPLDVQGLKLRFEEIYSFFKDITSGINHLHLNGFIHRDLKPSNCLLHQSSQGLQVLVSDFGEVQVENMVRKSTGHTGTVSYCAPEVLRQDSNSGEYGNFSTKSDIFSLGMILYFLCFARLPYRNADYVNEEDEDLDLLREEIVTWTGLHEERKLRPDLPEQLYTFLRRLLSLEPADRPSAEDVLLGIKTGSGLDHIADQRPNKGAHMFDDLSASSRISPVDSPRPSTPVRRSSAGFTHAPHRNVPSKMRFSAYPRDSPMSSPRSVTPTSPLQDSDLSENMTDSLVLRPPFPSPTRLPGMRSPSPPSAHGWQSLMERRLRKTHILRIAKIAVFALKALSLNILCSPVATKSSVMTILLGLAIVDFLLPDSLEVRSISMSMGLHAAHLAVLLGQRDALCLHPGLREWVEI